MAKIRINAYVPERYWELTLRLAKMNGVSRSEILRRAMKSYLIEELGKERKANAN